MKSPARTALTLGILAACMLPATGSASASQPAGDSNVAASSGAASSGVTVIRSIPSSGNLNVTVPGGNSVKFSIESNMTTGYAYTVKTGKNTAVSRVSKVSYVAPTNGLMGAPGRSVVTVKPSHSGVTKLTFTLTSPSGEIAERSTVTLEFMND